MCIDGGITENCGCPGCPNAEDKCGKCLWKLLIQPFIFCPIAYFIFSWLVKSRFQPSFAVYEFDVFAIGNPTSYNIIPTAINATSNTTTAAYTSRISIDMRLKNRNFVSINYDALNLSLHYQPVINNSNGSIPMGEFSFPGFHISKRKNTHIYAVVGGNNDNDQVLAMAKSATVGNSSAFFRVDLCTKFRYSAVYGKKVPEWFVVNASADLEVNGHGSLVKGQKNKPVMLQLSRGAVKSKGRDNGIAAVLLGLSSLLCCISH